MVHTLLVSNPGPAPTRTVEIVSEPDSCITKISIVDQPAVALVVMRRFDRWCAAILDRNVPGVAMGPIRIEVESTSQTVPGWSLVTDSPAIGAWSAGIPVEVPLSLPVPWTTLATLEARSMAHAPSPVEEIWARYFRELDLKTNSTLLQERGRATGCPRPKPFESLVKAMAGLLLDRLHSRVTGDPMPAVPPMCETVLLSALQLHLLEKHIGRGDSSGWAALVTRVFANFASGRLLLDIRAAKSAAAERARSRSSNGGPNSAFFFLFAEFAVAAIDSGVDAEVWYRLLPGLVTAAEVYVRCYGELSNGGIVARRLGEYSDLPARFMSTDELESLLAQYSVDSVIDAKSRLSRLARASLLASDWSDGGTFVHHPDECWFDGGTVEFPCKQSRVSSRASQVPSRDNSDSVRVDNP